MQLYLHYVFLFVHLTAYCAMQAKRDVVELKHGDELNQLASDSKYVIALFCEEGEEAKCARSMKAVQYVTERMDVAEDVLKSVTLHDAKKAASYELKKLPQLLFFRSGSPIVYIDQLQGSDEMVAWFHANLEASGKVLTDDTFEHDTQAASGATTGDWLVLFYDSEKCSDSLATWEAVASKLKQKTNVARVDTRTSPRLVERFKLERCATIKLFRHGAMYDYMFKENRDVSTLVTFAENWYKNLKSTPVPQEPSPFDRLTEDAAKYLKSLTDEYSVSTMVVVCVATAVVCACAMLACLTLATRQHKVKAA